MNYHIIQPPFSLKFREMPKKELASYFEWFLASIPGRIEVLSNAMRETPGFAEWQPDLTPESLIVLGDWLNLNVNSRPREPAEILEIKEGCNFPIEVLHTELSNRSFSLAMDAGMYFGKVLIHMHPSLRWHQDLARKQFADYGQPVVVPFGAIGCNPVGILVTLMYGFSQKVQKGCRLREVYEYW